jgi:hypothetical protein
MMHYLIKHRLTLQTKHTINEAVRTTTPWPKLRKEGVGAGQGSGGRSGQR